MLECHAAAAVAVVGVAVFAAVAVVGVAVFAAVVVAVIAFVAIDKQTSEQKNREPFL